MSKKKQSVMEKERANFIYGNAEEGVPGCVSRGIGEQVASGIFDDMTEGLWPCARPRCRRWRTGPRP